ncbi:hypothetical protein GCM10011514_08260 [Emticicia aquatilis]|uniref:YdhG-like domain-containing protein n=1 Tax=Emticicia aquatilis TaxID=1537369 RepID=A0A917DKP1_9BACT|nr:DUF1801 domain-containing protein [Emticicia aquatilis]GGD46551.1 hypothetical protein GCM10011514_08260 [Emticicia aquatilis]
MKELDNFYHQLNEPLKSCLMALSGIILAQDTTLKPAWKYQIPFFCYKEKIFCYLSIRKKDKLPYLGMVEGHRLDHPALIAEKRSRIKVMFFDPSEDLPIETIDEVLQQALMLYKSGIVKVKK